MICCKTVQTYEHNDTKERRRKGIGRRVKFMNVLIIDATFGTEIREKNRGTPMRKQLSGFFFLLKRNNFNGLKSMKGYRKGMRRELLVTLNVLNCYRVVQCVLCYLIQKLEIVILLWYTCTLVCHCEFW